MNGRRRGPVCQRLRRGAGTVHSQSSRGSCARSRRNQTFRHLPPGLSTHARARAVHARASSRSGTGARAEKRVCANARTHARAPSAFTHARMARARVYLDSVCTGPPCTDSHEDHIRTRCRPCRHRPMLSARRQTLQNRSGATNVPTRRSGGLAGAAHGVTF